LLVIYVAVLLQFALHVEQLIEPDVEVSGKAPAVTTVCGKMQGLTAPVEPQFGTLGNAAARAEEGQGQHEANFHAGGPHRVLKAVFQIMVPLTFLLAARRALSLPGWWPHVSAIINQMASYLKITLPHTLKMV
jgi:hypothetical protein